MVIVTFLLVRIVPGDPVLAITGGRGGPKAQEALREQLHLNDSVAAQFLAYVGDLLRGDLGNSIVQQDRPVASIIGSALPITLALVLLTTGFSLIVGVPVGMLAARRQGILDVAIRTVSTLSLATPPFFLGLLLVLVASKSGALPAGGWGGSWPDNFRYLVLPSLALSGYLVPLVIRTTRQAAADVQREQWVEAAIARGVKSKRLVFAHIFPNSLLPIISLVGYNVGMLFTGAVVVEAVFGLPGLGRELQNAIVLRDYPVIQGIALVSALLVVASNLSSEVVISAVDPRTRS